jgi:hypothetical protein
VITTRTAAAQARMASEMAALYDADAARFAAGMSVYFGSQVWTVGMEVQGLAQITRGDQTRYVGINDLRPVTAQDEFRSAAFAYLKHTK